MEDELFGQFIAKSIAETLDGEIKEFKIEIQQKGVSLNHETRKH